MLSSKVLNIERRESLNLSNLFVPMHYNHAYHIMIRSYRTPIHNSHSRTHIAYTKFLRHLHTCHF